MCYYFVGFGEIGWGEVVDYVGGLVVKYVFGVDVENLDYVLGVSSNVGEIG